MRDQIVVVLLSMLLLVGCQNKSCEINPQIAAIPVNLKIQRLEKALYASKSKEDVQHFLQVNRSFTQKYLQTDPNR